MKAIINDPDSGKYYQKICCGGKINWSAHQPQAFEFTDKTILMKMFKKLKESKPNLRIKHLD